MLITVIGRQTSYYVTVLYKLKDCSRSFTDTSAHNL